MSRRRTSNSCSNLIFILIIVCFIICFVSSITSDFKKCGYKQKLNSSYVAFMMDYNRTLDINFYDSLYSLIFM